MSFKIALPHGIQAIEYCLSHIPSRYLAMLSVIIIAIPLACLWVLLAAAPVQ